MSNATLESILTQHAIPLGYWPEMRACCLTVRAQQGTIAPAAPGRQVPTGA